MLYDVIIIGKGPAGISAGLYLARANRKVCILGAGYGSLERAEKIENYYGSPGTPSGKEICEAGWRQASALDIPLLTEEVLSITMEEHFTLTTDQAQHQARCVLLATGKPRTTPPLPGLKELSGRGVSYCAVCDGFFYRDRRLALLGNSQYTLSEYEELRRFTDQITICTGGRPLQHPAPADARIDDRPIEAVVGEGQVAGIRFAGGETLAVDGVFVAEGTASASDFALKLGIFTTEDGIPVDENYMTNFPGVFAAGDCIGGLLQVAKAVSDGAQAAMGILRFLKK